MQSVPAGSSGGKHEAGSTRPCRWPAPPHSQQRCKFCYLSQMRNGEDAGGDAESSGSGGAGDLRLGD